MLPIAQREMLILAKSPGLYRTRIVSSIALLVLGIGAGFVYHYAGVRALGSAVQMLTFILFTMCLFVGVQLTADSIAREKREGTLGLLFLTHLTPFQIVFGKLIANGLMGVFWLLIAVPLLSLLLIVGGMRGMDLVTLAMAGLNTLFFSAAVGLFASSRHADRRKASAAGTWIVMFFWWGVPLLVQVIQAPNAYKVPAWLIDFLSLFSVTGVFNSPFAGPRVRMINSPWMSILCTHLMAWGFLGLATFYLRRRWQEVPARPRTSLRDWWKNLSLGKPAARLRLRQRLLDQNPFLWLASRDRFRSATLWGVTVLFLATIIFASIATREVGVLAGLTVAVCILHKLLMASTSSHQLVAEQEQGTLEMLISTPLKVEEVLKGQVRAVFRQFRGPVALCLLLHLVAGVLLLFVYPIGAKPFGALIGFVILANAFAYLFDLYALAWAGIWSAFLVRNPQHIAGTAMIRIIVLPCVIFGAVVTTISYASRTLVVAIPMSPVLLILFWFVIGFITNICWLAYIRKRLPGRLRTFALKRYSPDEKRSWFQWLRRGRKTSQTPPALKPLTRGTQI